MQETATTIDSPNSEKYHGPRGVFHMINARYLGRLAFHGTKLVGQVAVILAGLAVSSVWEAIKAGPPVDDRPEDIGPIYSYLGAVEAFDRGQIGMAEMAYYRSIYRDEA
jgi:hypothetical protein